MSRWLEASAVILVTALGVSLAIKVIGDAGDKRHDRELVTACAFAAGSVRSTMSWLAPDHPRREAGLLLLSRDAAWAPVCARDRGAGAKLRSEIDAALAQQDAPGAVALASRLVIALENR
jgi:hypothetical protein